MEEQPEVTQPEEAEQAETGAERVNVNGAFTLGASSKQDLTMNGSLAFGAAAGRDMEAADSVSIATAVGRDLKLSDSAAVFMTVGGSVQMESGGAAVTLCRDVTAQNATLGLAVAQNVNLGEGSKVNMTVSPQQAAIFGAAFGAVFALLSWLLRRK